MEYYTGEETLKILNKTKSALSNIRYRNGLKYKREKTGKAGGYRILYEKPSVDEFAKRPTRSDKMRERNKGENNPSKVYNRKRIAAKEAHTRDENGTCIEDCDVTNEQLLANKIKVLERQTRNKIYYFSDEFYEKSGYISIRPNEKQAALLEAWMNPDKKVFVFFGGNRLGKTAIAVNLIISSMMGFFPWDREETPIINVPTKIRWVGQDWEKHIKQVIEPALDEWWPKMRSVSSKKNNFGIRHFWMDKITGSTLEIMSNKSEAAVFEGWEGDLVVYDEPPRRDVRVACARGLVDRNGRELFSMTLLKEPWVHREIVQMKDNKGLPDNSVFSVQGTIYDNVGYGISEEGVEQFAKTLSADERDARLYGVPSYMSGLVLPQFSRDIHLKERFKIPLDYVVDIAIDVHPRKEQCVLFVATDQQNRRYVCDEICQHGSGKVIAEEIIRKITANMYRVGRIIIDPLAKADSNNPQSTFEQIQQVLWAYGHFLETASKDKDSGIITTKDHLLGPNREPSMWIFNDLRRTLFEIEGWMYDSNTGKPMKEDDDMMENLYRIMLLDTQWFPPHDDDDNVSSKHSRKSANEVTGY